MFTVVMYRKYLGQVLVFIRRERNIKGKLKEIKKIWMNLKIKNNITYI